MKAKDENPPLLFCSRWQLLIGCPRPFTWLAKVGIADLLADGPQSYAALAIATGSDPSSLFRRLRALSSVGVFSQVDNDRFALSRLSEVLRSDASGSLRCTVITIGEIHYQACGELLHSVRSGSPAFDHVFGTSLFDYLQENAEASDAFTQGMTNLSSLLAYAILLACDFSGIPSMVDIGGGEGQLLRRILELNPEMTGVVFDLPNSIGSANRALSDEGRCSYVAGNFFESVPEGADAYLLCGIVHDWDDDRAITVLRNCPSAMTKKSRVLLVDMIVPDTNPRLLANFSI